MVVRSAWPEVEPPAHTRRPITQSPKRMEFVDYGKIQKGGVEIGLDIDPKAHSKLTSRCTAKFVSNHQNRLFRLVRK